MTIVWIVVFIVVSLAGGFALGRAYAAARWNVAVKSMWLEMGSKAARPEGISNDEIRQVLEYWLE